MIGKRGQFYLIAAIIIVLVLYSLSTRVNTIQEQPRFTDFNKIAENYRDEVTSVVNYGVYNRIADIKGELVTPFTQKFLEYARTRDKNLGLVYVYADNSKTVIENHLSDGSIIYYDTTEATPSAPLFSSTSESISEIGLKIGGETFVHDVPVKLGLFSPSYYSTSQANGPLQLGIAGVPYLFDTSAGSNQFEVVIKTENAAGVAASDTCVYSSSGVWTCT